MAVLFCYLCGHLCREREREIKVCGAVFKDQRAFLRPRNCKDARCLKTKRARSSVIGYNKVK